MRRDEVRRNLRWNMACTMRDAGRDHSADYGFLADGWTLPRGLLIGVALMGLTLLGWLLAM